MSFFLIAGCIGKEEVTIAQDPHIAQDYEYLKKVSDLVLIGEIEEKLDYATVNDYRGQVYRVRVSDYLVVDNDNREFVDIILLKENKAGDRFVDHKLQIEANVGENVILFLSEFGDYYSGAAMPWYGIVDDQEIVEVRVPEKLDSLAKEFEGVSVKELLLE
ncbi:hypothetical protein PRVXT_002709 [Proteinivorax tanatarense]|uniref:Uncharacterized protein n=1 Tax=Proteinivorax tanatarense TaxID=1260629 RepID=A0AAU7VKL9_9FIRM